MSTIERVVKQYRAPEGEETKITAAHFVGRVIEVISDDGTPEHIRVGPDELPEQAQRAQVARLARDRAAEQAAERDRPTRPTPPR